MGERIQRCFGASGDGKGKKSLVKKTKKKGINRYCQVM